MTSHITWEIFLNCAKDIVKTSTRIGDSWSLEGAGEDVGETYLKKCVQQTVQTENDDIEIPSDPQEMPQTLRSRVLRFEYHVYYSISYANPVLCFNVWSESGSLVPLQQVWNFCNLIDTTQPIQDLYNVLTQQEHPLLRRPFFTIHPCRTHEILNVPQETEVNVLVRYISSVGPMVNLSLDMAYGNQTRTATTDLH